jgi:hypothetical protein
MSKARLDATKDTPEKRDQIDKYYVVAYTKLHGTPEQKAAIKKCIKDNTVERISNFTKKPYTDVKMKEVRNLFCSFFFPSLNDKPGTKTFDDLLDDL